MAINLSDSQEILDTYASIIDGTHSKDWLLLKYTSAMSDELSLLDCGSGGMTELKNKITDLGQVYIAFCRVQIDLESAFLLINYIPNSVSGVKRARALVHSRRIGTIFKKHQTTLTVNSLDNLTLNSLYQALTEPDLSSSGEMGHFISRPLDVKNKALPDPIIIEQRSSPETYPPATFTVPPIAKSTSMFSNLIRRKKKSEDGIHEDADVPPPIPPKDKGEYTVQPTAHLHMLPRDISDHSPATAEPMPIPRRRRTGSLSEYAVISHSNSSDEVLIEPSRSSGAQKAVVQSLPLRSKRDAQVLDPVERVKRRLEAQQRREIELEIAFREEAERQAELRRRKEQFLKEEQEAEAQRRVSLENELRRITAERRRKALLEHEEEARRQRELEERRRLEKERRLEEHKRLEEWRREQASMADEAAQRDKELRRHMEDERRRKIQIAEAKVKRNKHVDSMLTGWVTIQASDSLFWKRRFFKFVGTTVHFYRSPKDAHQVLDTVELYGKIQGIREWSEGYDDLEAIPYSFVIEFADGRGPWSMFADSEDEKYKLLGLLYHAAGL